MGISLQHSRFQATDPRGRIIICTLETWLFHILSNHPELAESADDIRRAIEKPQYGFIYRDVDYENRDIYYYRPSSQKYSYIVVVEFDEMNRGEVITAYRISKRKSGERIIWPE